MKLSGEIQMSRTMGGNSTFHVSIRDKSSGLLVCEISIDPSLLGDFMSTRTTDCTVEVWPNTHLLGTRREGKTVCVPFTPSTYERKTSAEEAEAALKPYETDGWKGQADDLLNHHRATNNGFTVFFHRFVNAETGEPIE